jgi:hypothetical protein
MIDQELRLVLQVALLGEVGPALRAVGYRRDGEGVTVRFHFDGPISHDDSESAACVVTELIAALPEEVRVSEELVRCDFPETIPTDLPLVFRRRE